MFKVGDLVRIKPFSKIKELDQKFMLDFPDSCTRLKCGKVGKITGVTDGCYKYFTLNISGSYNWAYFELIKFIPDDLFIPLYLFLE